MKISTLTLLLLLAFQFQLEVVASEIEGTEGGRQPQIVCDERGFVHLAYGMDDKIIYSKSEDIGQSFSRPVAVAKIPKLMVGMRRGPRIAAVNNVILVTAPTADLLSFVSTDDGKTWSKATRVNDIAMSAREGLHNVAAIPGQGFFAIWLDARNGKGEVWGAFSADGLSWDDNRRIYQSPNGSICECCHPSVATSKNGDLTVMWRNSIGGSRDMFFAKSRDRGTSFSKAAKLGNGTWNLQACPMDGGSLAMTADGSLLTVWRREDVLYKSSPGQEEIQLANGKQPVVAISNKVPVMAWNSNDTIYVMTDGSSAAAIGQGNYPCLTSDPKNGNVFCVWESSSAKSAIQFLGIESK